MINFLFFLFFNRFKLIYKVFIFFEVIFFIIIFLFECSYADILLIKNDEDSLVYYVDNKSEYTVLINCSVHGDEGLPSDIINQFLYNGYFNKEFSYANYVIVLKPSKYRLENKTRYSLEKIDPNRTYISLFSNSSKLILSLLNDYDIDLILDLHEASYRNNIDFMYSNGFYSKFLLKFLKTYDIIYDTNKLKKIFEIENKIKDNQNLIFNQLYQNYNINISKYYINENIGGYDYVSILRNYGIIRKIPTVLFETVNKQNKKDITYKVYYYFFSNLKNYLKILREYKIAMSEIEYNFKMYYLFDKNYDNIDILKKYLNLNKIRYYYFEKLENFDKCIEYNIKEVNIDLDKAGLKGLIYVDFEIYKNQILAKNLIYNELDNSIIIPFSLLSFYLLDPNSKESLFNFDILPMNYYKLKKLPLKVLYIK